MKQSIFDVQHLHLRDYLFQLFPAGKLVGKEFLIGDIFGSTGSSLSFNIEKGCGQDFAAAQVFGSIVELVQEKFGLEEQAAFRKIEKDWGMNVVPIIAEPKKPEPKPVEINHVPFDKDMPLVVPGSIIDKFGEPTDRWLYETADGRGICWVVRFDPPGKKKEFKPFIFGENGWLIKAPNKPRVIYNLPAVIKTKDTILITEGEKDAEAAKRLFPSLTITTWGFGSNSVKTHDWTPMEGKKVAIIWRDNDLAGKNAEQELAEILVNLGCNVKIFKEDAFAGRAEGWGAADLLVSGELEAGKTTSWLKSNIIEYPRGGADSTDSTPEEKQSAHDFARPLNAYFKCLGQVGNKYYFYNYSSGQVSHVNHDGLNEMFLLTLSNGRKGYWETEPGKKPDWKYHAGTLIEQCHTAGQFDIGDVRGRGTWEDAERIVTNTGDGLIVGATKMLMSDFESDFVYLRSKKLNQNVTAAASREELQELLRIIEGLRWDDQVCSKLLAGWLMAAPVCGALPWRSHLYVSGPAGSGKSWLYENIISRVLNKISMRVSSKTTEAGIRHALGPDALPVIFDEAEAESVKDAERMQGIMDLARQASSPDGAPILKGTAGQEGAKVFYIRSSFCFLSIMPSIRQYADETRITILTLKHRDDSDPETAKAKFKHLAKDAALLFKGNFSDKFISYSCKAVKSMRQNFQIFAEIGSVIFGNKRIADQLAMLLAGYYAYFSNGIITEADATALLEKYNWQSVIPSKESNNQARLLMRISQFPIEVQIKQDPNKRYTRSIGELIEYLASLKEPEKEIHESFSEGDADSALRRRGIRYDKDFKAVLIANHSEFLKTILTNSPWSSNWAQALKAIHGSCAVDRTVAFGGFNSRAMSIPVLTFLDTSDIT